MSVAAVIAALDALAGWRPVFHSEADFQHALAWQLQLHHPRARIRLETRPLPGRSVFLDLLLDLDGAKTAVELKYPVRGLTTDVDGERFELRAQSAHDVRRYDLIKDIGRLEAIIGAGAADVGVVVALTNDPAYWTSGREGTVDAAFRIHDGITLSGTVAWAAHAGAGTTAKRTEALTLRGSYEMQWRHYSDTGDRTGRFRALVLSVTAGAPQHPMGKPQTTEPRPAPALDERHSRQLTCRQEILEAFAALERRHARNAFSLADVVAETLACGSTHSEATIRTHIASAMCVNASPNHSVRYPDLERVARGLYRRSNT